jgi:UDP-N-acetylglucosamine acyltransferase
MPIHPLAVVDPGAQVDQDVEIGPYAVIDRDVVIGPGCRIMHHASISRFTRLGKDNVVYPFAAIGGEPQDLKYEGEQSWVEIGDGNTIREFVTVNRGTKATGATRIGDNCLMMAYAHAAHDCLIGDHVVMANCVALAGHVTIGHHVIIGGLTAVQQFVRIGDHVYLGGTTGAHADIAPYTKAYGYRAALYGINSIGLARNGFSAEVIKALKDAYRILFRENMSLVEAISKVEAEVPPTDEVKNLTQFMSTGERGFAQGYK